MLKCPDDSIELPSELPKEKSFGTQQLNRAVRLPHTHRPDDEMVGSQGQMHHFADVFQAHRTDM